MNTCPTCGQPVQAGPELKTYDVWSEGYNSSDGSSTAIYYGQVRAASFQAACDKIMSSTPCYNSEQLTYWGCKLFDNEADARRSFG